MKLMPEMTENQENMGGGNQSQQEDTVMASLATMPEEPVVNVFDLDGTKTSVDCARSEAAVALSQLEMQYKQLRHSIVQWRCKQLSHLIKQIQSETHPVWQQLNELMDESKREAYKVAERRHSLNRQLIERQYESEVRAIQRQFLVSLILSDILIWLLDASRRYQN
jgi:iron-sulfur cluster repair protein YtfE (RIC family)